MTCMIPNCRKYAPATEPFCREHRGEIAIGKSRLRDIYDAWQREEVEAIELIEAVGRYLGK